MQADLAVVKFLKSSKVENCVDCLWAHGSRSGKKCDTWAKAREANRTLTLSIPTMLILMSQILCVGKIESRAASACIIIIITTPTKISAPRRLQNADFPPPALLLYETHNERRLGNKKRVTVLLRSIGKHIFFASH